MERDIAMRTGVEQVPSQGRTVETSAAAWSRFRGRLANALLALVLIAGALTAGTVVAGGDIPPSSVTLAR
jgi:hypothetical protein